MSICTADIYTSYDDFNNDMKGWRASGWPTVNADTCPEGMRIMLLVRKWTDSGRTDHPAIGMGLTMSQHVILSDKWDLFIYE